MSAGTSVTPTASDLNSRPSRAVPPRLRRLMLLGLSVVTIALGGAARADSFTPQQRAEIIAIVRDALKQDPSILRDAVTAMQADESAKTQANTRAALAKLGDSLVSPADPV